ncbi:MAG: N-acetyl-gamma-glutamyl-phosphate reductase [Phycisphaeraceae bacterium]|nr:N-acetyl-gamma-glutamyl-phosphate reductase [Phycisphaeraceae bacterium]MCB9847488.1 N-acetyl-gamma-glutamyl-phosphate reductase [Phycisphaeraceae bacterium]
MSDPIRASIVGGTGYTGGELARLLVGHPSAEVQEMTSRSEAGQPVHRCHPNLRGHLDRCFIPPVELQPCDALFLCMPHGEAARDIDRYLDLAPLIIDCSADFRLRDAAAHREWYGQEHPAPELLSRAVYGLPELHRNSMRGARLISGVGCNATAMILALLPLARAGLIGSVLCDIKVGSSESGAGVSPGSHHPERSGACRTYSPAGHRHSAEVFQALGEIELDVTVTAIEMVRGVLCTAHVRPTRAVDDRELWGLYGEAYAEEPFVRIVRDRSGLHRLPDPNILAGSNHADIGFAIDPRSGRIVVLCAIDNLVKGAAGSAVQSMNLALGLDETQGLTFPGLHPR